MNDYVIFTDASGDFDLEHAAKAGVEYISMQCESDGNIFDCTGHDDDGKLNSFYADLSHGSLPKTTQITPFRYEEIFEPVLSSGKNAICLCLSSGLSSTFESAKHAAESLAQKFTDVKLVPIDTLAATTAMGLILDRLIDDKLNGMTLDEAVADIERFKRRVWATCFVDDLHHLKRGGRLSAAAATFGTMLKIKPIIRLMPDGTLENVEKCRGIRKALSYIADVYDKNADKSYPDVYISDAANDENAQELAELIKEINPDVTIKRKILSPIIGTHLGPDSVVIGFVYNP